MKTKHSKISAVSESISNIGNLAKKFVLPNIQPENNPLKILGPAGEIFEFIKTADSTLGKYIIAKTIVPPGAGPTPHMHHAADEWFYTPKGGITLFMGKHKYDGTDNNIQMSCGKETLYVTDMTENELIYVPRRHLHAFVNNTNKPQLLYMIWTPEKNERSVLNYFKHVGQVVCDINNIPEIEPMARLRYVAEAPKFGISQSHNFWQYVDKIEFFPLETDNHSVELLDLLKTCTNSVN